MDRPLDTLDTEEQIMRYCRGEYDKAEREVEMWERLSLAASALLMFLIIVACRL